MEVFVLQHIIVGSIYDSDTIVFFTRAAAITHVETLLRSKLDNDEIGDDDASQEIREALDHSDVEQAMLNFNEYHNLSDYDIREFLFIDEKPITGYYPPTEVQQSIDWSAPPVGDKAVPVKPIDDICWSCYHGFKHICNR